MHNLLSFPFCRRSVAHFKLKMTLLLTQNQQFNCTHLIFQPHKTSHLELHIFVQKITLKSPGVLYEVEKHEKGQTATLEVQIYKSLVTTELCCFRSDFNSYVLQRSVLSTCMLLWAEAF